ncbi:uncharacterized protein LOC135497370 [Lineus longissimus]|uniref:uncharacterized protein LOC135497370 n=1 Tax=Lineus longissimus TaxID=88925 RepID=UPI00315CF633
MRVTSSVYRWVFPIPIAVSENQALDLAFPNEYIEQQNLLICGTLLRSGTAEEYTERDSLLTEISQMKDESHVKKASETKGSDDKDIIKQGEAVRKHAMEGMAKKDGSTPSKKVRRTQSMSEYVEYKKAEIELRKEELEVRKQELQMEREEKGRMFSMMKTMLESMKK